MRPVPEQIRDMPTEFPRTGTDWLKARLNALEDEELASPARRDGFLLIAGLRPVGRAFGEKAGTRRECRLRGHVLSDHLGIVGDVGGEAQRRAGTHHACEARQRRRLEKAPLAMPLLRPWIGKQHKSAADAGV